MEIHLSLPELQLILDSARDREFRQMKFTAALKGVELDDPAAQTAQERFDAVESKAMAMAAGISEQQYEFADLGMGVEEE